MKMVDYCGLGHPYYHYKHVLDISDGVSGLEEVLQKTTAGERKTSGWVACTVGNSPSFYDSRISSPHVTGAGNLTYWTSQFCTAITVSIFESKFSKDLELYRKTYNMSCIPVAENCIEDPVEDQTNTTNTTQI